MIWRTAIGTVCCLLGAGCADVRDETAEAKRQSLSPSEQCRLLNINGTRIIGQYDQNGDGKLDRAEFKAAVSAVEQTIIEPMNAEAEFKQKDLNSDGFIELNEFARVPSWVGQPKTFPAANVSYGSKAATSSKCKVLDSFRSVYAAAMPPRRLTGPPADLQWCVKCRRVLGDHGGWFGPQCMGHEPRPMTTVRPGDPWGMPPG